MDLIYYKGRNLFKTRILTPIGTIVDEDTDMAKLDLDIIGRLVNDAGMRGHLVDFGKQYMYMKARHEREEKELIDLYLNTVLIDGIRFYEEEKEGKQ